MAEERTHIVIAFGAKRRVIAKPRTYGALMGLAEHEFGVERGSTLIAMMNCPWNKYGEVGLHYSAYATVVDGTELRFERVVQAEAEARPLTSLSVLCNAPETVPSVQGNDDMDDLDTDNHMAIHPNKGAIGPNPAGPQIPVPRALPRMSVATSKLAHPQPIRLPRALAEKDFPLGDGEFFMRATEARLKNKAEQAGPPASSSVNPYIGSRASNQVPYTPPNQVIGTASASTTTQGSRGYISHASGQQGGPQRGAFPAMTRGTTLGAGFGRSKTFSSFPDHQEAYAGYDSDGMPSMP